MAEKIYIDIRGDANRIHALDKLKELGYTWWYGNKDLTEDYDYVKDAILCLDTEDKTVTWRDATISPLPREELDKTDFGCIALSVDEVMSVDELLMVEGV